MPASSFSAREGIRRSCTQPVCCCVPHGRAAFQSRRDSSQFVQEGGRHRPEAVAGELLLPVAKTKQRRGDRSIAYRLFLFLKAWKQEFAMTGQFPQRLQYGDDLRRQGTMCCSPILMRSAGMRHSPFSSLNSDHFAHRNSPGRTKTRGAMCRAEAMTKLPSYPSIARISAPTFSGPMMVGNAAPFWEESRPANRG